jgi:hypothetical protein
MFVSSVLYFQSLSQKKDLELQKNVIIQRKVYANNLLSTFGSLESKLDTGSEGYKVVDMRLQQIQQMATVLDSESAKIDMQLQAVNAIMQSSKKETDADIQREFNYMGAG